MAGPSIHPRAEEVLRFWLGDALADWAASGAHAPAPGWPSAQVPLWFKGGAELDARIRDLFGADLTALAAGDYDAAWAPAGAGAAGGAGAGGADEAGGGRELNALAGVILADQFSRNVYRGSAKTFDLDPKARAWAKALLASEPAGAWPLAMRMWLFMTLEHSESLEDQERCVTLFEAEVARAEAKGDAAELAAARDFYNYAVAHLDVIRAWGRFPHRNALLGRDSTPAEVAGLADGSIRRF